MESSYEYASEELLQKFRDLGELAPWQKEIVSEVLESQGVKKVSGLTYVVARSLYEVLDRTEVGLAVMTIPNTDGFDAMSDRNKRRLLKTKSKLTGIRDMLLSDFQKLSVTDQFLFLRDRIPAGHMPVKIEAWRE